MIKLPHIWRKMKVTGINPYQIPTYKFALREDLLDHPELLPTRAEPQATGWDVRCAEDLVIKPFEYAKIRLGLRGFCPEGWWYELKPRSSTFTKKKMHALYGTIDETYEGELVFACQYIPNLTLEIGVDLGLHLGSWFSEKPSDLNLLLNFGDAIGQLIPVKRQEMIVESISNEEYDRLCKERNSIRGAGGFGSTGR
jgi:dUTPase